MLVVKTYLDHSKINGIGVFAKENIPAKALVWEYVPEFDVEIAVEHLPEQARQYIFHYGNLTRPGFYLFCGDNARFMNHSDNPNISADDSKNWALRDIAGGEEITCNYREFVLDFKGF